MRSLASKQSKLRRRVPRIPDPVHRFDCKHCFEKPGGEENHIRKWLDVHESTRCPITHKYCKKASMEYELIEPHEDLMRKVQMLSKNAII
jgi:hypothetical protein